MLVVASNLLGLERRDTTEYSIGTVILDIPNVILFRYSNRCQQNTGIQIV
jgi:hypothetical protein